jgi:DNA-binding IclR family transcriptional regulator
VEAVKSTAPGEQRSLSPAITRASTILDLLASSTEPMGVSLLSRSLGLPKSSVANICATLVDAGLLRPVDGGYALGSKLARLGAAYLAGVDQVQLFHSVVDRLTVGRQETAQLATLGDAFDVVYLARRDGTFPVHLVSAPGVALPASCTATGKAMLASLGPEELAARLEGAGRLPRLTARSITSPRALRSELEKVRRRGYAVDREEVVEGVVCIGVVVPEARAEDPPLAVSFTLLAPRAKPVQVGRLARELAILANEIAFALGALSGASQPA